MSAAVEKRMRIIKTCNIYLTFLTQGMSVALMGPCLLDLQHLVRTDTQHIALIFTATSTGYVVGGILGGILLDRVKSKQAALTACNAFATAAMFAIPWTRNFETLIGFMVVNGISHGAIETGGNVICLQLWWKNSDPFFQALHFSFGLGGIVSPLIASPFLDTFNELSPAMGNSTYSEDHPSNFTDTLISSFANITSNGISRIIYPFSIVATLCLVVTILLLVVSVISPTENGRTPEGTLDNSNRGFLFMFFTSIATFLLFFVTIGTQTGYAQTLTTYAVKGRLHTTTTIGSYITSAFWASLTISRLASVFLAIKINSLVLIISDVCIMAVSALVLFFFMPSEWALWLASVVFGVGVGPCYAALVGWLNTYINVTNKISAIFTVGSSAGQMVVPFLITFFMDSIPEMFLFVTAASSILLAIFLFVSYCIFINGNSKTKDDKKPECHVTSNSNEQECYAMSTEAVIS